MAAMVEADLNRETGETVLRVKVPIRNREVPEVIRHKGRIYVHSDEDWRKDPYQYFEPRWMHEIK